MQPYYEAGGVTIYHGDCRAVLPTLPRGGVDLIVTDPPYGVGYISGWHAAPKPITGDSSPFPLAGMLRFALDVLRPWRHLYIFGHWDLSDLPLGGRAELIWDKDRPGMGNLATPWGCSHEPILFATYEPSAKHRREGRGGLAARLRQGSVLRCPFNSSQVQVHPTEKPVRLLRQLIESSSIIGEVVLDPFMGVGSTLVAAQLEGRQAIGIEIEERYCETAAKRLEQARQQLPLEVPA